MQRQLGSERETPTERGRYQGEGESEVSRKGKTDIQTERLIPSERERDSETPGSNDRKGDRLRQSGKDQKASGGRQRERRDRQQGRHTHTHTHSVQGGRKRET